jgi:multiple sugar transport system ATP-binding protein
VRDPKAFLMDEPLSNLDAKLRVQTRAEITRIQRRLHTTTVYVTHDQTEAMTLGDRLVVMQKGLIQQVGTPDELYARPRNLFVAGFIGAPSMNLMAGEVEGEELRMALTTIPLNDELRAQLNGNRQSRRLVVGIRPEDFQDASLVQEQRTGHLLTAPVDVLEDTGADVYAHLAIPPGELGAVNLAPAAIDPREADTAVPSDVIARLDASSAIQEGQPAKLWLDTRHIHLFDPETGERLQAGT